MYYNLLNEDGGVMLQETGDAILRDILWFVSSLLKEGATYPYCYIVAGDDEVTVGVADAGGNVESWTDPANISNDSVIALGWDGTDLFVTVEGVECLRRTPTVDFMTGLDTLDLGRWQATYADGTVGPIVMLPRNLTQQQLDKLNVELR